MSGTPHRLRRATNALAVLSRPDPADLPPDAAVALDDPAGRFLESVLANLGDLRIYSMLDVTANDDPRLGLDTNVSRRYSVTLPRGDGPYEVWACCEMPVAGAATHFAKLREREEVLAQALQTQRLAWHQDAGDSGWIGLPVALAKDHVELDDALGQRAADTLRRLFFTVERICSALDEREAARRRRRDLHRPTPYHRPGRTISSHVAV